MSVKYGKFEIPSSIVYDNEGRFVAEPFERGFGHTVGNSIRRVLLSALESPAIISVAIEGVPHEFTAIEGVIEDFTNIVLNLKGALLRKLPKEGDAVGRQHRSLTTIIEVTQDDLDQGNGQVSITLGRVIKDSHYEVVNPDLHLFTVTTPFKRQVDLRVAMGRGYVPAERLEITDRAVNEILIDASFTPVRNVNYYVENTRVGQDTDFDKLVLEIDTDGRVTPQEALSFAAQILRRHLEVFNKVEADQLDFEELVGGDDSQYDEIMDKMALRVDEIELSVRSTNCLAGANIETIAELVSIPERRMLEFRNFGKKSLNEIKAKLHDMGLGLGMDLSKLGFEEDDIRGQIHQYIEERKAKRNAMGVNLEETHV
jgi:DNA-directed RNA polymerase subunit alpha